MKVIFLLSKRTKFLATKIETKKKDFNILNSQLSRLIIHLYPVPRSFWFFKSAGESSKQDSREFTNVTAKSLISSVRLEKPKVGIS